MKSTLCQLFSLEALDDRLVPSANQEKRQAIINKANPVSRWHTIEFKIYALVFIITIPLMFKAGMEASNEYNPNYHKFEHLLSQGWLFGRKVDNSDTQYRFFRDNMPLLFGMIILHVSIRKLYSRIFKNGKRTSFDFGFGLIFLFLCHGVNSVRILIHMLIIFSFAQFIRNRKLATILTWVYGIITLFINDYYRDSKFGVAIIDQSFTGIIPRWDVFYNFTLLRMISFNMDFLERKNSEIEENNKGNAIAIKGRQLDDRSRLSVSLPLSEYSIYSYMAYLMYAPLFIAGPVITFNDYLYQSDYCPSKAVSNFKRTAIYFGRLIFCILTMEFILHFMYVVAVSKTKAWEGDTPFQISMLGMFNLNIIWLKLLIPWRMFRFWSLLDGIDPPENMIRCMDNNFSALAFWRAWHRSFNRWVIKYIYIPLGGRGKYRIINNLCVFSFVAIWHDIELKLLIWGWLVVLFLIPEIAVTMFFKKYENNWWYRHLCAIGAVANIWMMMIANLYGFCLGNDGTAALFKAMFNTYSGFEFFVLSSGALFVGAQVMFELRQTEVRRGIDMRC